MGNLQGYVVAKAVELQENDSTIKADKNGALPILLDVVGGAYPSYRTINGTVAGRQGIVPGGVYLMEYIENPEPYVDSEGVEKRQFDWNAIQPITSPLETLKACRELGPAKKINVDGADSEE